MAPSAARLDLLRRGEALLLDRLASLGDAALAEPCVLPGWSRGHLAAHLARNADAIGNLLTWARTGTETPMYASAEQRAADIEAGARQAPVALRADVEAASARLLAQVDALADTAWDALVRTARSRPVTAAEVPWMRIRETWVHAVDLDAGVGFADLPAEVVGDLLDDVTAAFAGRDDCPAAVLSADDADDRDVVNGRTWRIGPAADGPAADHGADTSGGPAPVAVSGPADQLLAWVIGRSDGPLLATDGGVRLPSPPRWL